MSNTTRATKTTTQLLLIDPMTTWLNKSQWLQKQWNQQYDPNKNKLCIYNTPIKAYSIHTKWRHSCQRLRGTTRGLMFHPTPHRLSPCLPLFTQAVDTTSTASFHRIGLSFPTTPTTPTPTFTNWGSYVNTLPTNEQQILHDNTIYDLPTLHNHIKQGKTFIKCCDGGAADLVGSFGSIISDGNNILATVQGHVPGLRPHSFCTEAYGVLSHLLLLLHQQIFYHLPSPYKLIIYCDNNSLLSRLRQHMHMQYTTPQKFPSSEIDVILCIQHTLKQLASSFEFCHVKGHQDNHTSLEKLPRPAQLCQRSTITFICISNVICLKIIKRH